jgi:hypothetical protein
MLSEINLLSDRLKVFVDLCDQSTGLGEHCSSLWKLSCTFSLLSPALQQALYEEIKEHLEVFETEYEVVRAPHKLAKFELQQLKRKSSLQTGSFMLQ